MLYITEPTASWLLRLALKRRPRSTIKLNFIGLASGRINPLEYRIILSSFSRKVVPERSTPHSPAVQKPMVDVDVVLV